MFTSYTLHICGLAGKGRIELLLALGATRMEATRETMQRCLVLALTPVLNQMSVMGVVSIPGMMTGQILGGTVPSQVRHKSASLQ
jgi:putative ABC transport system permease protein